MVKEFRHFGEFRKEKKEETKVIKRRRLGFFPGSGTLVARTAPEGGKDKGAKKQTRERGLLWKVDVGDMRKSQPRSYQARMLLRNDLSMNATSSKLPNRFEAT